MNSMTPERGKIYKILVPYYDVNKKERAFKSRPGLILAKADAHDYVVLPVSTVSNPANRDPFYDVEVDPAEYPKLNLARRSYVRTHKQTTVYCAEIGDMIGDMKSEYEELYREILARRERFSQAITEQALF